MSPQPQNLEPTSSSVQLTPPILSIVQSFDSLVKGTHLGPGCCNIFGLSIDHCSDFDHCQDWAELMSTLRDSSAWSEVYYVRRVGETDSQDVYTVFSDHTNDCAVGAKYEREAISVALFWTLKASLSMPSGDCVKIRACACGLNDSADLECHTLLFWLTHSISLTSNMQSARQSSRLLKLKDVESDPPRVSETASMNSPDIPLGSCPSSWKRHRRRGSAGDTSPPPEHIEPEVESLSDEEFSDDNPDDAPLLRPQRKPMTGKFISMAAIERFKDLRGRKFIPQQCISLTDDNFSDVRRIVTGAGLIHTLTDIDPYQLNVVREFIANLFDAEERDDGVAVYVRGSLVDFSPSLINSLYCIPGFEEDPNWMDESIDEVLYKLVCSNWIPTMNYTSMNQKGLRFVYMIHHHNGFSFGKLDYDQIMAMAENTKTETTRCIMFPTLIQQVLLFQRTNLLTLSMMNSLEFQSW
ncbi:hypothetical protein F2Q69_00052235 [Brassica cretica]|uniref:Putative plant transposon protein domain-containing protein n=1 Tax=Brassica cretica TaxID=69181 RepID=A0A8S9MVV5_BRACR|nr:hypothetical protein F2Q69_00052235 [Brassica cretica]